MSPVKQTTDSQGTNTTTRQPTDAPEDEGTKSTSSNPSALRIKTPPCQGASTTTQTADRCPNKKRVSELKARPGTEQTEQGTYTERKHAQRRTRCRKGQRCEQTCPLCSCPAPHSISKCTPYLPPLLLPVLSCHLLVCKF